MSSNSKKNSGSLPVRILFYAIGFVLMTLGIAISVKSDLGVSPISSIPYTATCVIGLEMGRATIFFHIALVLIQILILRTKFEKKNLLQIPVGIVFGYLTTFCNSLVANFPSPTNLWIRIAMMLVSAFFLAAGVFFYVPADIVPLAGEGTMLAVTKVTKFKFSSVKLGFDSTMVLISLVTCLLCLHRFGSVGIGTVIAAVLVGSILKVLTRFFGSYRDRALKKDYAAENAGSDTDEAEGIAAMTVSSTMSQIMKTDVYTVSPDMNVKDALRFLTDRKISGAPVINADQTLYGYISDGDILRYLSGDYSLFVSRSDREQSDIREKIQELSGQKVKDICSRHVATVTESSTIEEVSNLLKEHGMKKIPVTRNGKLIGVVNRSTIVHFALRTMEK